MREALETEVQLSAGMLRYLSDWIGELDDDAPLRSRLTGLRHAEMDRLMRLADAAIKARVPASRVRMLRQQGAVLARAIHRFAGGLGHS